MQNCVLFCIFATVKLINMFYVKMRLKIKIIIF